MTPHTNSAEWAEATVLGLLPIAALGALLAAYLLAVLRTRRAGRGWSSWRLAGFAGGIALLAIAVSPPMMVWGHHDLRGHMAQHLLLGMIAPLGLVLAAPVTLLLRTLPVGTARRLSGLLHSRAFGRLTHPVTALAGDGGALYALYLTPLFAATLVSPWLHGFVHLHFLAAGSLFVWAIAGPDPAPHRARWTTRLAVLLVAMAAHATLAKMMYAHGSPRGTPHEAEQIRAAAQLMYYGGDVAELLLAIALFRSWYRTPRRRYGTLTLSDRGRRANDSPASSG